MDCFEFQHVAPQGTHMSLSVCVCLAELLPTLFVNEKKWGETQEGGTYINPNHYSS